MFTAIADSPGLLKYQAKKWSYTYSDFWGREHEREEKFPQIPKKCRDQDNSNYFSQGSRGLIQKYALDLFFCSVHVSSMPLWDMSLWLPLSCFSVLRWCKSFGNFSCLHFPSKHTEWKHTTKLMHQDVLHPSHISMLWVFCWKRMKWRVLRGPILSSAFQAIIRLPQRNESA